MKPAKRTKSIHTGHEKMGELIHGKTGSNQYLAYRIRHALNPIEIFVNHAKTGISTYSEEEFEWVIELLAKVYWDYDLDFFDDQKDGLKKLSSSDPSTSLDPRFFFVQVYSFLCRDKGTLPTRIETIDLAKRMWAITRLTQRIPDLPLPGYKPAFERKIRIEISGLPEQKWSRHREALGLEFSKAKRGRKPKRK
jgi:hypothetical protein